MIPSAGKKTTWAEKSQPGRAQVSCPNPLARQGDLGYQAVSLHPETQTPGNPGLTWHCSPILLSVTGSPILGLGRFLPSSSRQAQHLPRGRAPTDPPQDPEQRPSHPPPQTPHRLLREKNIEPGTHYNRSRSILISGSKCLQGTCSLARAMTENSELLYPGLRALSLPVLSRPSARSS